MRQYRILIVEDEVLIAEDLFDSLSELGYEVCGICHDSESALRQMEKMQPDFIILDIHIRGSRNGIELAEIIRERYEIPFIFLTSFSDRETIADAKKTRPRGYLVKPFREKDLLTTIETAIFNHEEDLRKSRIQKEQVDAVASKPLSEKEYVIFLDLIDGKPNQEIAEQHFISINTVKTHVRNIFSKLEVHDRVSALRKVIR